MKTIVAFIALLASTSFTLAYNPIIAEPPQAYEIINIEGDPYVQREYLGDLSDFPDMYELTSDINDILIDLFDQMNIPSVSLDLSF